MEAAAEALAASLATVVSSARTARLYACLGTGPLPFLFTVACSAFFIACASISSACFMKCTTLYSAVASTLRTFFLRADRSRKGLLLSSWRPPPAERRYCLSPLLGESDAIARVLLLPGKSLSLSESTRR